MCSFNSHLNLFQLNYILFIQYQIPTIISRCFILQYIFWEHLASFLPVGKTHRSVPSPVPAESHVGTSAFYQIRSFPAHERTASHSFSIHHQIVIVIKAVRDFECSDMPRTDPVCFCSTTKTYTACWKYFSGKNPLKRCLPVTDRKLQYRSLQNLLLFSIKTCWAHFCKFLHYMWIKLHQSFFQCIFWHE